MKYDLIIVGGGPTGLAAAKTAAEDGLKVLLVERRTVIAETRLCGQFTNIKMTSVSGKYKYGYSEPFNLEVGTDETRFHYPALGLSIDYNGALRPYLNYIHFSPSGYKVYREKDRFIGFCVEKEALLRGLATKAEKAGAEILTRTLGLGAENTANGVKVSVRDSSGKDKTFEARKAIAADGHGSLIAQSLGLSHKQALGGAKKMVTVGYVLEGVETEYRLNSWVCCTIPSLNPGPGNFWMFMLAGDRNILGTMTVGDRSAWEATDRFMKLPFFEPWFCHARIVKKLAVSGSGLALTSVLEPVKGNVLVTGNAASYEVTNPGGIACGYMAVKAIEKELNGQKGYPEYIKWWQNAFEGNSPTYLKAAGRFMSLNAICSNEEIDYLYQVIQGQVGVPAILVARNLDRIKEERPELYERIRKTGIDKALDEVELDLGRVVEREK
jgi:digeranylgeranylglycerophospholipid reductase